MRTKIYQMLVNRQIGIAQRYHKVHDGTVGLARVLSYVYLIWINIAFYLFFCKWLGKPLSIPTYEEKRLPPSKPESQCIKHVSIEALTEKLLSYDVISFDIFDTLIFRPFSEPSDLFFLVGQKLGYMDFKRIRMEAEYRARIRKFERKGSYEVNLKEIWQEMNLMTGIEAGTGYRTEVETELALCYANPYMQQVYRILRKHNKRLVMTSDMYLPGDVLEKLLKENGYNGFEHIFVSCELQKSKADGSLFSYVRHICKSETDGKLSLIHVGDNKSSDIKMASKKGFSTFWYPNVNQNALLYRAYDMSPVIGGAYRGLVNNRIYQGTAVYSRYYEYGYIYGGLFILGYCCFIHDYCKGHNIDKLLFIARDGEIIQKVYRLLYPEEETAYVYLSRLSAAKLTAGYFKYDYIRKMIRHKVNQNISLKKILKSMELSGMEEKLTGFVPDRVKMKKSAEEKWKAMRPEDKLTNANIEDFIEFIYAGWTCVLAQYADQRKAAGSWYRDILGNAENAAAVDIGWAGSGALALKVLFEKEWKFSCRLTGILAGTNTIHNAEPDMSETMLLDGTLVSYLYSSADNRDLYKKHNPAQMYNVYFELFTSSAQPSFQGFYFDRDGKVELRFQNPEKNPEGIREIQKGILDFAGDYIEHFKEFPFMFHISGRDAYAPMLLAAGFKEDYLKRMNERFQITIGIN